MPRVFVNGTSAKSGGGRSILTNFLRAASDAGDEFEYVVAVGRSEDWKDFVSPRVRIIEASGRGVTAAVPWASLIALPRLASKAGCNAVFNLSDVPMRTCLPQVFLFDWSYAAFPESAAWTLSTWREWVVRKLKLLMFHQLVPQVDILIAQTEIVADRLKKLYNLRNLTVVPNAVSLDNLQGDDSHDFKLSGSYHLLCLSRYYSHKNIEVFLPLAEHIRDAGEDITIVTTISPNDGEGAQRFLSEVAARSLNNIILNVGTVPMEKVPSLYRQTDALLLPTLLESFSGTYVEAMFHRKPILTSRLPFAEAVCGKAAWYFNPTDPTEILACVRQARDNCTLRETRLNEADEILAALPDWPRAYAAFAHTFRTALEIKK